MACRHPEWLRKKITLNAPLLQTKRILAECGVGTVCESGLCPNLNDCFSKGRVTFMILGDLCSRKCRFCSVKKGFARGVDEEEPVRIAEAASRLKIRHAVVTSVTRDDLDDGGAGQFVKTIEALRKRCLDITVEALVPDFKGEVGPVRDVALSPLDLFGHNIETVSRLFPSLRGSASYDRSIRVLDMAKKTRPSLVTKSGIMLGLGEDCSEVSDTMRHLRNAGCDMLTIGQYLRPAEGNVPVSRFIRPEEYQEYKRIAYDMGFLSVASGPFVRSSYLAEESYLTLKEGIYERSDIAATG